MENYQKLEKIGEGTSASFFHPLMPCNTTFDHY